jgi:5'-methylthioadenosine phosphorylase
MLAIIGGSGLTQLPGLHITRREVVRTPYGMPSGALTLGELGGHPVIFLARHGYGHTIPPHLVNYRANLWALHAQQVSHVIAIATVGSIHPELRPGRLVVPDQIIDYTHGRDDTFADYGGQAVTHQDFTWPYCETMRQRCLDALNETAIDHMAGGTYGCVQGPRLETKAEVERMARDGCDMVGMTAMPEAYLARELGLCYASLGASVNWAAGREGSSTGISAQDIEENMKQVMERIRTVLIRMAYMTYQSQSAAQA